MNSERSARRRLKDSRNNSFSLSFNNECNESGLSFLIDSPILLNSPKNASSKLKLAFLQNKRDSGGFQSDSSTEVIEKSACSTAQVSEFDWIKTPRSARNRKCSLLSVNTIDLASPVSTLNKRKSNDQNISLTEVPPNLNPFTNIQSNLKTPLPNLLAGSRRRNVDNWLDAAVVQPPTTPPMSLSPPINPHESSTDQSDIDPEVKEVLKVVYGEDWQAKSLKKCQTDIKRSRYKSPQPLLTDVQVLHKRRNFTHSEKSTNRKNVRRKVFDDIANTKSDHKKVKTVLSPTKKIRTVKRKRLVSPCTKKENLNLTPIPLKTPSTKCSSDFKTPRRTFLASLSVSTPTTSSHPDAQMYKLNFAKKKDELCARLFKLYNIEIFDSQLPSDMLIEWNKKMRGTAGYCYSKKKKSENGIVRVARLELSPCVIDRADRLRDTLIHEMCHAASWIIDGVQDGHGTIWLSWAQKVALRFPELPLIKRCHNYKIMTKFTYRCTVCAYSINRQSRSIDILRKRCGRCYGILELLFNKKKKGMSEAPEFETTRTIRAPNRFAMFVKENYKRVKSSMPSDKKHADVMKLLGEQYSTLKASAE